MYDIQKSVCPPKLQKHTFTVSAIDNLNHNPSSSTSQNSFHGTGISIFQFADDVNQMFETALPDQYQDCNIELPSYYTTVEPTKSHPSTPSVSTVSLMDVKNINVMEDT